MAGMSAVAEARAVVRRIYEEGFDRGVEAVFDECYAPGFVHHSKVIFDVPPGGEGEKQSMRRFRDAIPGVRFEVLDMVGDERQVVVRLHIHGHAEEAYGTVPAGPYDVHAVAWFRIAWTDRGTQVAEEWLFVDAAA
jgi:predicted ester cyclase